MRLRFAVQSRSATSNSIRSSNKFLFFNSYMMCVCVVCVFPSYSSSVFSLFAFYCLALHFTAPHFWHSFVALCMGPHTAKCNRSHSFASLCTHSTHFCSWSPLFRFIFWYVIPANIASIIFSNKIRTGTGTDETSNRRQTRGQRKKNKKMKQTWSYGHCPLIVVVQDVLTDSQIHTRKKWE